MSIYRRLAEVEQRLAETESLLDEISVQAFRALLLVDVRAAQRALEAAEREDQHPHPELKLIPGGRSADQPDDRARGRDRHGLRAV